MPGKSKHGKAFKKRKLTRPVQPEMAAVAPQAPAAVKEISRATVEQAKSVVAPASALAAKVPLSHLLSVGIELRTIAVLAVAMAIILIILSYVLP